MTDKESTRIESYLLDREKPNYRIAEMVMEAVEKQIPKKIKRKVITSGIILYHCPVCNEHYYQINLNFCQHCGQALDWSDTE